MKIGTVLWAITNTLILGGMAVHHLGPPVKRALAKRATRRSAVQRLKRELGRRPGDPAVDGFTCEPETDGQGFVFRLDRSDRVHPLLVFSAPPVDLERRWPDRGTPIPLRLVATRDEQQGFQEHVRGLGARLSWGWVSGHWSPDAPHLGAMRDLCVRLGDQLAALSPLEVRLTARLTSLGVQERDRALALALLDVHFPDALPTARAHLGPVQTDDQVLRYVLARTAPDYEAVPALEALVRDPALSEALRRQTLDQLLRRVTRERAAALFAWVTVRHPALTDTAWPAMVRLQAPVDLASARRAWGLLPASARGDIVARVVASLPPAQTIPWLLEVLGDDLGLGSTAAAQALARVAGPEVIPALQRVADYESVGSMLHDACLDAIASIRARHAISAGGLAVVDADGGQLALAEGEGGLAVVSGGREEGAS